MMKGKIAEALRTAAGVLTLGLVLTSGGVRAAEPVAGPDANRVAPELAPDPAVTKIIEEIGEGCATALPPARTAGDINDVARKYGLDKHGPGARDYCIKMAWMPDRKRAIFYGANHGVPHRLNDVWEYDLPSNTWVCLYGPDANKGHGGDWSDIDRNSEETKAGIIRTKRGGPAIIPHSWWNMTYDHGLKAMITPCSWSMSDPELFNLLNAGKHKPPFWAFFPEKKRWEPILGAKGDLPGYENARQLEYVPELNGTLWAKSDGMWLYNSKENTWKRLGRASDYKGLPEREAVMVYLPDRKLLVAHSIAGNGVPSAGYEGSRTSHYSVEKNEWKTVFTGNEKNNPPAGFDGGTNFVYDSAGKVCLLWDAAWTRTLWAYDPETCKWTKLNPKGPPPPAGRDAVLAYYDAARNAFVIPGKWIYRHRNAAN
ncbi:MAG: hypothetical protein N3A38_05190 [Planctomycetota bacterium]|nr:hypothetical protein [Planctomycetota bacterium]